MILSFIVSSLWCKEGLVHEERKINTHVVIMNTCITLLLAPLYEALSTQ